MKKLTLKGLQLRRVGSVATNLSGLLPLELAAQDSACDATPGLVDWNAVAVPRRSVMNQQLPRPTWSVTALCRQDQLAGGA